MAARADRAARVVAGRHPGHRVHRVPGRPDRRARAGDGLLRGAGRAAGRDRAADRLHHRARALLGPQGGGPGRLRPGQPQAGRRQPGHVRDAPGGAGQGPRRRRRSRAPPGRRRGQRRHYRDHGRGPAGRDRPAGPAVRDVGAHRRGHGRFGPAAAGDALAGRRRRRRGLAELEPAQVAGDPGGLLAALRGGPGRADPGHVDQPVLPAVRGRRRGDPVQGLGHSARPPVPRAQAVVPAAAGRGRGHPGPAAPRPGQRPLARRAGRGGPRLAGPRPGRPADRRAQARTRRAQARTRGAERAHARVGGRGQHLGRGPGHAVAAGRRVVGPGLDRGREHRTVRRRAALAPSAARGRSRRGRARRAFSRACAG